MKKIIVFLSFLLFFALVGNAGELFQYKSTCIQKTTIEQSFGGKKHRWDGDRKNKRKKKLKRRRGRRSYGAGGKNGYTKRYNPFDID